ncbi:MAG TPA: ATP-binding cassette domain-containing protein [Tepidimicrobium sp.]|nr:ATP-binding cassette domain-containing protein [Tepidimicrobium sp.]
MLLEGKNLSFKYPKGDLIFKDVNISIKSGEIVGLIGRSGCGKSTLAKVLAGYERPVEGQVLLDGKEIPHSGYNPIQLIYQHPEKSINPRWRMKNVLEESGSMDHRILEAMGIERDWLSRYSRELSGGELQRFSVARALNDRTRFIIADEISTMLDAITQAQIWNVILDYGRKRNLGLLVITHNLHLAQRICTRIINFERMDRNGE